MRSRVATGLTVIAAAGALAVPVACGILGLWVVALLWISVLGVVALTDWGARRILPHQVQVAVILLAAPVAMFLSSSFGGLLFAPAVLAIVLAHAVRRDHPRLRIAGPAPELIERLRR